MMTIPAFRLPKFNLRGTIDCEIFEPAFGWIPFTVEPSDEGARFDVQALDQAIRASGNILPYDPPPQVPIDQLRDGMSLTFAQLLIGLVAEEWITEAEGEAWLAGSLPAAVVSLIDTLPSAERFPARARAMRPSVVLRLDPLVAALAAAQGKTPAELDAFFMAYAAA